MSGEIRSFNNKSGVGSRLIITVLAREILPGTDASVNRLLLTGTLCKLPVLRRTPLGREICDLILAVNRKYGRADYIPCIAWGRLAREAACLQVGDRIRVEGRLQSRAYIKTEEESAGSGPRSRCPSCSFHSCNSASRAQGQKSPPRAGRPGRSFLSLFLSNRKRHRAEELRVRRAEIRLLPAVEPGRRGRLLLPVRSAQDA